MNQNQYSNAHENTLYSAYDDIIFKIALTRLQNQEILHLEERSMSESEQVKCAQFFLETEKRTLQLIERESRKLDMMMFMRDRLPRVSIVVACVALTFFIGLTVAVAAIPPVRSHVLSFISSLNREYSEMKIDQPDNNLLIPPSDWRGTHFPTYSPEGFIVDTVQQDGKKVVYSDTDGAWWSYCEYDEYTNQRLDIENATSFASSVNMLPAEVAIKGDIIRIVWSDDNKYYLVNGSIPLDQIFRIANSNELITN